MNLAGSWAAVLVLVLMPSEWEKRIRPAGWSMAPKRRMCCMHPGLLDASWSCLPGWDARLTCASPAVLLACSEIKAITLERAGGCNKS